MFEAKDFLLLARRAEQDRAADPDIVELLRDELEVLSIAYRARDRAGRLLPSNFPGYLEVQQDGWRVFVPWTLAAMFPAEPELRALLRIAAAVAVQPGESICLSGSSVWIGRGVAFSDVDCCQYLAAAPAEIARRAAELCSSTQTRVLVGARYGDATATTAVPPWPDGLAAMAARMAAVSEAAQAERLMLEFLILCDVYDLLPVSNVVLGMVEGNRDSGAAQQSFVFQEAVAVRDGAQGPHWSLVDPSQLAAYLTFLRAQIEQYTGKNPIKAVKRALSLASTLRLADFVDRSLDLLKSTGAASAVAEKRLAEIQAWATRSGDAGKVLLGKSRYNGSGSPSPASGDETEASATQIVRELLDHVKMLERAILGPGSVE